MANTYYCKSQVPSMRKTFVYVVIAILLIAVDFESYSYLLGAPYSKVGCIYLHKVIH